MNREARAGPDVKCRAHGLLYCVECKPGAVPYVAPHSCEWTWDEYCWETTCGNSFIFETDGPAENQAKFCQYCGGNLVQMPYADDPEDGRDE